MPTYFDDQPPAADLERTVSGFGAWFEIDLDAVSDNLAAVRARVGPAVEVMPVVKNNAYGHGLRPITSALAAEGIRWVMVAKHTEALAIRSWGLGVEVVSMDALHADAQYAEVAAAGITQVIYAPEHAERLAATAQATGRDAQVFVKIDTGLRRVGVDHEAAARFVETVAGTPGLALKGVFSTFMQDPAQDGAIFERYMAVVNQLDAAGVDPGFRSMASSNAIFHYPHAYLDMVRPAMSLFGVYNSDDDRTSGLALRQALCMKARVEQIKPVKKGESVTYFGAYIAPRDMRVATVHAGFYDGLLRELRNAGTVTVGGTDCPSVGSVSLNHYLFDCTDADVAVGDAVTLIGRAGANDLASTAKTAGWMVYSLVNHLNPFVPRVYTRGGAPVAIHAAGL